MNSFNVTFHGAGESTVDYDQAIVRGRILAGVASHSLNTYLCIDEIYNQLSVCVHQLDTVREEEEEKEKLLSTHFE